MSIGSLVALAALAAPAATPDAAPEAPARAQALSWSATVKLDVIGPTSGFGGAKRGFELDESSLTADLDLDKAIGWRGGSLHGWLRNTSGSAPNETLGTIDGVDNLEGRQRLRLFEFFLQQDLPAGKGDIRAGLIGLDSSFYVTDSSGLLVNPSFGIPPALGATGENGPAIYPSSALAVQATWRPVETVYAQLAAFNAKAGTIGDPDGVDTKFDDGALVIGEVGVTQGGKIAVGAWGYTKKADAIRAVKSNGDPAKRNTYGAYLLAENQLNDQDKPRAATSFVRLGISQGDTTEIKGDAQAGLSVKRLVAFRPNSELAVGLRYTRLSRDAVRNAADAGDNLADAEYGLEVSLSDSVTPWLAVQPNIQVIQDPGGRRKDTAVVAGLRLTASFSGGL